MYKALFFFLFIPVLLFGFVKCDSDKPDSNRGYIVKIGDMAPEFTMLLTNGETISLQGLRGE